MATASVWQYFEQHRQNHQAGIAREAIPLILSQMQVERRNIARLYTLKSMGIPQLSFNTQPDGFFIRNDEGGSFEQFTEGCEHVYLLFRPQSNT